MPSSKIQAATTAFWVTGCHAVVIPVSVTRAWRLFDVYIRVFNSLQEDWSWQWLETEKGTLIYWIPNVVHGTNHKINCIVDQCRNRTKKIVQSTYPKRFKVKVSTKISSRTTSVRSPFKWRVPAEFGARKPDKIDTGPPTEIVCTENRAARRTGGRNRTRPTCDLWIIPRAAEIRKPGEYFSGDLIYNQRALAANLFLVWAVNGVWRRAVHKKVSGSDISRFLK